MQLGCRVLRLAQSEETVRAAPGQQQNGAVAEHESIAHDVAGGQNVRGQKRDLSRVGIEGFDLVERRAIEVAGSYPRDEGTNRCAGLSRFSVARLWRALRHISSLKSIKCL